jgi:dTDP-4-dehydrorhamnose reductase
MRELMDPCLRDQPDRLLELWGGHECTVNRVGDQWYDQTIRSGHETRIEDLGLFAGLGIRKLRYPALWERISPQDPQVRDFRWTDERVAEIRRLGMDPILTLCHHGSGPAYTSLLDPGFARGLARHAAAVAARYPWVRHYTPVNEPLTTARFSALYGYWYPHATDEGAFWTALLNETDATRLAMREIRKINPDALLVQTDDLGFCHATAPLQAEARFQNERRWMGWDLLCGTVVPGHALWSRLASFGLEDRLRHIADDPCPPDIIGINHYLSSERLLDHRIELHADRDPADRDIGQCGEISLVDVDAARQMPDEVVGLAGLIEQAWQRYRRPIAITECHLASTRDEQARWFLHAWEMAEGLRRRGIDLRAVTAWSLLGSYDWNQMVTRAAGHYEPGVFDVRGGRPRPTMIAGLLADLGRGLRPQGPGLAVPGWWRQERRTIAEPHAFACKTGMTAVGSPERLMILRDGGAFAKIVVEACNARGLHYVLAAQVDEHLVRTERPWAIFDAREKTCSKTRARLAELCQVLGITALVLAPAGRVDRMEQPGLLILEGGSCFTVDDENAWAEHVLQSLEARQPCFVRRDVFPMESYAPCVVDVALDLLLDGLTGVVDLLPAECWTQAEYARALAAIAEEPAEFLIEVGTPAEPAAKRHSYLPSVETMLGRFVRDRRANQKRRHSRSGCSTPRPSSMITPPLQHDRDSRSATPVDLV